MMHIILGATGHIGSTLTRLLLEQKAPVTLVVRHAEKAAKWQQQGARIAVADVLDTQRLHDIFKTGDKLYLLNPNAPPDTDTATEEQRRATSILQALQGSGIRKVVAQSTYCAQPGEGIGDLGVLFEMEQMLEKTGIPNSILRAAYYMSNWDQSLESAHDNGVVYSFYPDDFKLPMVAPEDIAKVAARLMLEPIDHTGLHNVEGPGYYSPADVAAAFADALQRPVKAVEIPPDKWITSLEEAGFSPAAAASMAAMTTISAAWRCEAPESPERGNTTLQEYIRRLVQKTA
ncbi:MAG TPA: NmrA family NAD(P)-binding protein [Chitinophaga sp.]